MLNPKPLKILLLLLFFVIDLHAFVRIMPLGDSITFDARPSDYEGDNPRPNSIRTGYRSHLYYTLQSKGFGFDFVGSQQGGWEITPPFDPDNEGHPGWHTGALAVNVYDFLSMNPADIVLLHSGTNHGESVEGEIHEMNDLLNEIDRFEHDFHTPVRVVLALIIPERDNNQFASAYNNELLQLANRRIAQGDDIIVVDMEHNAGLTPEDYYDELHPNDMGYAKIAAQWVAPILEERDDYLYYFPITLVPRESIREAHINEEDHSVTFTTLVPDSGITF